jgi:RNA polymerase sigma-70 factor (ECF subfamily)
LTEAGNQIIAKAREGDRTALNELVSSYWPVIYRLALAKTGNREDAQEIAQETFVRVLAALPRYKETGSTFKTYLSRIALNLITDYYRKRGRSPQVFDIAQYNDPIIDTGTRPDEAVVNSEQRQEMARVLTLLPEEQRRVIELRIIQGIAVADVAQIMGKSAAAIKMLQQRALKKLKDLLAENGLGGGEVGV